MIRVLESKPLSREANGTIHYREFAGLSTDGKPTSGIATGSVFVEVDTGKVYLFSEADSSWTEVSA